ncbi:class I SAM-dependent methyltransferase [Leptospira kanakyensis]|uniref:Class I SAM-dependent methyltransferase n=1 Tax=Leptospira kanakyensis TaxID=2484968 RepID=A0A6N4QIF3_9LEPT|nr:class I SAM-dependent methyltransferase [Leptospira kanakyensis]TGK51918.1 class I SAM-dependent methyltransferase [Leptospira kanakyensis]TGK57174.1 class I SAM-dependent methyltransferase [Leptospira kanakyensis]TGK71810.1 class I SAM-dependent methyltransferase [Leptospira kanakyensis]
MSESIKYTSKNIAEFYSKNRIKWDDFYNSEKVIFENSIVDKNISVLDLGCGCGGLGIALMERFGVEDYTGIDIQTEAVELGKSLRPTANIYVDDIFNLQNENIKSRKFDLVVSLSCIDWNLNFDHTLKSAWDLVKDGGVFISTFRLTNAATVDDIKKSYQYINFEGKFEGEIAPYVVLNVNDLLGKLSYLDPKEIKASGYWGQPSKSAKTIYESLCFAAFAIRKKRLGEETFLKMSLELPLDLFRLNKV